MTGGIRGLGARRGRAAWAGAGVGLRGAGVMLAVAGPLALGGCAIAQHPDATLGPTLGAASTCSPSTARISDLELSNGPSVLVLAERARFVDGKQTDPAIVQHSGITVEPTHTLDDLGGDPDAWIGAISTAAAHELTLPPGFGDAEALTQLGAPTGFPTLHVATGSYVFATIATSSALDFRVTCGDATSVAGRIISPGTDDERTSVLVQCDGAVRQGTGETLAEHDATRLARLACDEHVQSGAGSQKDVHG